MPGAILLLKKLFDLLSAAIREALNDGVLLVLMFVWSEFLQTFRIVV